MSKSQEEPNTPASSPNGRGQGATSLGEYLKQMRGDISSTLVARDLGVSSGTISLLERDKIAEPSPHLLYKLAQYYFANYQMMMTLAGYPTDEGASLDSQHVVRFEGHVLSDADATVLRSVLRAIRDRRRA